MGPGNLKSKLTKPVTLAKRWERLFVSLGAVLTVSQEQAQLAAIRQQQDAKKASTTQDKDFEGGFGGQEDLEDRYATTSGEH